MINTGILIVGVLPDFLERTKTNVDQNGAKFMLHDNQVSDRRVMTLIHSLSSTLSNIDAEFAFEIERMRSTAKPDLRPMLLNAAQRRDMQRREPYVRQLAELRRQIKGR